MSSAISFRTLVESYTTWSALHAFLTSAEGGKLFIVENFTDKLAIIRYVKGESNMDVAGMFRSVVWNTETNRPVSVTPFKSETGEGIPAMNDTTSVQIEQFVDGVMIGQFWDATTQKWRLHTRSTLDAKCRYFSKRSFAELFADAVPDMSAFEQSLDKSVCYTWILTHPENRIVCPVTKPRITLVAQYRIAEDATVSEVPREETPDAFKSLLPRQYFVKGTDGGRLFMMNTLPLVGMVNFSRPDEAFDPQSTSFVRSDIAGALSMITAMDGSIQYQGVVIKVGDQAFKRWKLRSRLYKTARHLRGNSARRDFLWMDMAGKNTLGEYLRYYPEERIDAMNSINRWKTITQEVYKVYVDVFKARSMNKTDIPAKLRPLVYGLHNVFMNTLRPIGKSVDWNETIKFMNSRDTAQKIFVLNWDLRQERSSTLNVNALPFEPLPTMAAVVHTGELEEGEVRG